MGFKLYIFIFPCFIVFTSFNASPDHLYLFQGILFLMGKMTE